MVNPFAQRSQPICIWAKMLPGKKENGKVSSAEHHEDKAANSPFNLDKESVYRPPLGVVGSPSSDVLFS